MPQSFEIVRAKVKDDAVVLIGRLMRSKQDEIVLVLPKNSIIAADLDSLKTLKEEAESIGKTLSLNTDNDKIKSFAKTLGILIYSQSDYKKAVNAAPLNTVKKIKIMTDILPPFLMQKDKVPEENIAPDISELQQDLDEENEEEPDYKPLDRTVSEPVIYETGNKNPDLEKNLENFYSDGFKDNVFSAKDRLFKFSLNRIIVFFAFSGLVLFMMTMYLILPRASIRISLKEIPLKTQIPITVSKNINSLNLAAGIIPGQYFLLNKSGSKQITGSSKIMGTIEIFNAYGAVSQKLVAQTRFETKEGKIFKLINPVIIPGAKISGTKLIPSSIKAGVIGDGNSDDYLIGPDYFTIPGFKGSPKYAGFYAKSTEPMARKTSISLNKEELEKIKNEFSNDLAQELKMDIMNTLKDSDLQLVKNAHSVKIDDFKISDNIINMKITWQAILFKEKDLRSLVDYFISSRYSDLKNFAFEDKIVYPEASRVDFKKGELFFIFNIDKNNAIPADIGNLKKELSGRDENEMRTVISNKSYINSATISLWPFWVRKAPANSDKINITVDNK